MSTIALQPTTPAQRLILALLIAASSLLPTPALSADCERLATQAEQAANAGQLDALLRLARALNEQACNREQIHKTQVQAADLAVQQAQTRLAAGDLDAAEQQLQRAPMTTWLTEVSAGDIAAHRKAWGDAARHYNQAYTLMRDPAQTPQRPDDQYIDQVRTLAGQALVLSDDLDTVISRSSGLGSGIYAEVSSARSHRVIPAPVRFETDSAALTQQGREQAERLAVFLRQRAAKDPEAGIMLVGHADERGDADDNQRLSEQRAETLRQYLLSQGVTLHLQASGRGEQQPFVLPAGSPPLTNEERWQLDRRVELRFE